jgi:ribosomal protein S27AE
MENQIECINSRKEVFFAHFLEKNNNTNLIRYKCGVCSYGEIILDIDSNTLSNIKNDKCNSCKCIVVLK